MAADAKNTADVAVVGLGAMGAAVLLHLARRGVHAIGIDRHHPPHTLGSSHGESRITRLAVGEGPAYAPLVARSHALWPELEADTGEELLLQTGGLILAGKEAPAIHHGQGSFIDRTIDVARQHGIAHEVLDAATITRRWPQLMLQGDEIGFFEPSAGLLHPERCVAAQLRLAEQHGAVIRTGEEVTEIEETAVSVRLTADGGTIDAGQAVVAAGPWLSTLISWPMARLPSVHRQTLHWFPSTNPEVYAPGRFPVFIWMHGEGEEDYFYGFPMLPGSTGVKVASERYADPTDPETVDRTVPLAESASMHRRHVAGRLRGVGERATDAAACLYTVMPGRRFLVDRPPGCERITVVSACSGHGFKHSAALGEAVACRIIGEPGIDLGAFTITAGG